MSEMHQVLKDNGLVFMPTYCHGETKKTQLLSRFLSLFGFKVQTRWSVESFRTFVLMNNFNIVKENIIKDKIPLLYLVAQKR
jgi:hypothetical protein